MNAKLYIENPAIVPHHPGEPPRIHNAIIYAKHLSVMLGGIVELHVIMEHGKHNAHIDDYDTWVLRVYNNGTQIGGEDLQ